MTSVSLGFLPVLSQGAHISAESGLADGLLDDTQAPWYFCQGHVYGELLR